MKFSAKIEATFLIKCSQKKLDHAPITTTSLFWQPNVLVRWSKCQTNSYRWVQQKFNFGWLAASLYVVHTLILHVCFTSQDIHSIAPCHLTQMLNTSLSSWSRYADFWITYFSKKCTGKDESSRQILSISTFILLEEHMFWSIDVNNIFKHFSTKAISCALMFLTFPITSAPKLFLVLWRDMIKTAKHFSTKAISCALMLSRHNHRLGEDFSNILSYYMLDVYHNAILIALCWCTALYKSKLSLNKGHKDTFYRGLVEYLRMCACIYSSLLVMQSQLS